MYALCVNNMISGGSKQDCIYLATRDIVSLNSWSATYTFKGKRNVAAGLRFYGF